MTIVDKNNFINYLRKRSFFIERYKKTPDLNIADFNVNSICFDNDESNGLQLSFMKNNDWNLSFSYDDWKYIVDNSMINYQNFYLNNALMLFFKNYSTQNLSSFPIDLFEKIYSQTNLDQLDNNNLNLLMVILANYNDENLKSFPLINKIISDLLKVSNLDHQTKYGDNIISYAFACNAPIDFPELFEDLLNNNDLIKNINQDNFNILESYLLYSNRNNIIVDNLIMKVDYSMNSIIEPLPFKLLINNNLYNLQDYQIINLFHQYFEKTNYQFKYSKVEKDLLSCLISVDFDLENNYKSKPFFDFDFLTENLLNYAISVTDFKYETNKEHLLHTHMYSYIKFYSYLKENNINIDYINKALEIIEKNIMNGIHDYNNLNYYDTEKAYYNFLIRDLFDLNKLTYIDKDIYLKFFNFIVLHEHPYGFNQTSKNISYFFEKLINYFKSLESIDKSSKFTNNNIIVNNLLNTLTLSINLMIKNDYSINPLLNSMFSLHNYNSDENIFLLLIEIYKFLKINDYKEPLSHLLYLNDSKETLLKYLIDKEILISINTDAIADTDDSTDSDSSSSSTEKTKSKNNRI